MTDGRDARPTLPAHTDLIVVGAGSAGCVIAARATEGGAREVVLLEAGPDYSPREALPTDLEDGRQNSYTDHDWGYAHSPTAGQVDFPFPRGRVVGGSSAVNTCIALRGQPYDYDEWAERGLDDWSHEACEPYFDAIEDDRDFPKGQGGSLPIRRHPKHEWTAWQASFHAGCRAMGFAECPDHNAAGTSGVGPHAMNKLMGRRVSAASAFLGPSVRERKNLTICAGARVRRVLFEGRRAMGVELEERGQVRHVHARQVVLCAGAINTVGILLRSGVGPEAALRRLGVAPIADVPAVGRRLWDHPGAAMILAPRELPSIDDPLVQVLLRYTSRGSAYPADMQLQAIGKLAFPQGTLPLVAISCTIGKPDGAGTLRFDSVALDARPRIETRALEHPRDLERAVEAMELAALIVTELPERSRPRFLFPSERTLLDRGRIRDWIVRSCGSGYHPCGTVPMGPDSSDDAAVGGRGRVRGVEGLIVADASIMPTIPSANINLTTMMIGERFGRWLRDPDELR